jgi:hypothetical protein
LRRFFHKSAWYYDPEDARQIGQCFTTEYACLKDICRSDDACEQVLQYLEQAPHFSRPQFYTRPYSEHTTARAQYAFVPAAGMTLFNNMPELLKNFRTLRTTVCRPSTGCRTTPARSPRLPSRP